MSPLNREIGTNEAESFVPKLVHFKGRLGDINDDVRARRNDATKTSTFLQFDFDQLEVIEASEPYTFPTFRIEILEMNMPGTQWEVFKKSIRDTGYSGPLNDLIGKKFEMQYRTATLNLRKQDGSGFENREGNAWQVNAIEGVENTGDKLFGWIIEHVEGKTNAQFKSEYLMNAEIRGYTGYAEVTNQIMADTFLSGLVAGNVLRVDDSGVYHKV